MSTTEQQPSTDYNPRWQPEPGDRIAGKFTHFKEIPSKFTNQDGSPKPPTTIGTLQTADGPVDVFVNANTVLERELRERQIGLGDSVTITYEGKRSRKDGKGNPYHMFTVLGGSVHAAQPSWIERPSSSQEPQSDVTIDDADLPKPPAEDESVPF